MSSMIDRIVPAFVVEDAVIATIKEWIEVYLREIEMQWGVTENLPVPRSYNVGAEFDKWAEDQLPAVILISPGTSDRPSADGEGGFNAPFRVSICIFATGNTRENTRRNAHLYGGAVRAMLLQKRSLGGISDGATWEGEDYDQGPTEKGRTIGSVVVDFVFNIPGVVYRTGGPPTPPDPDNQPGEPWPTVQSGDIVIVKEEL